VPWSNSIANAGARWARSHPIFESPRTLLFAHRGGGGLRPENTLAAFDEGLRCGADGIELDVHLSKDAVVVVHHDATVDRTTGVRGALRSRSADELSRIDAAYWFSTGDGFPLRGRGIGVPTLAAVLGRYRDCRVIIELKVNHPELARAVVSVVRAADAIERVCVGSTGVRAIREVRALQPELATSAAREEVRWALYRSWCRWPVAHVAYGGYQVPEVYGATRVVSPLFVRHAHTAGLAVQVWTVDREDDARKLLGWGVDALITDRPDVVGPLLRAGTSTE
jgi:glycerophosphoryl diester phosphodiesterase